MEIKRLLRFYFTADKLDKALNNLIAQKAVASAQYGSSVEIIGQKMCVLIEVKQELSELWDYLDSVIKPLSKEDQETLYLYGTSRVSLKHQSPEIKRKIKKSVMKFTRHARNLDRHERGAQLLNRYYGLF